MESPGTPYAHVEAVLARQEAIEQHDVEGLAPHQRLAVIAACAVGDLPAGAHQRIAHQFGEALVVFDQEQAGGGHGTDSKDGRAATQ
jgi:hypothetical protein